MNNYQQIILNHIQSEYLFDAEEKALALDTPLIESGIIDSMGIFRLITFLQETFAIRIEPQETLIRNFKHVAAIADLVAGKMAD